MQVEYVKCWTSDDRLRRNRRDQMSCDQFFTFAPNHIFKIGEAIGITNVVC